MAGHSKAAYVKPKERIKQYKIDAGIDDADLKSCAASVRALGRMQCPACKNTWSTISKVLLTLRAVKYKIFGQRCKKCVGAYIQPTFKEDDWQRMLDEAYVFLSDHDTGVKASAAKVRAKCKSAHRADLCEECQWHKARQGDDEDIDDLVARVQQAAIAATASK